MMDEDNLIFYGERLRAKLRSVIALTFSIVNKLPMEDERKRIIMNLADRLTPMTIVHRIENIERDELKNFATKDAVIIDHEKMQFELEESVLHAFKVIDRLSNAERARLLSSIREVVWDFHNLVRNMVAPMLQNEDENLADITRN